MTRSKYGNRRCEWRGETFDSVLERDRWLYLTAAQARGDIARLMRQVPFELTPSVRAGGRVLVRAVSYVADFVYEKDGIMVIEDTKGYETDVFKVKRAVLRHFYGKEIRVVRSPAESI